MLNLQPVTFSDAEMEQLQKETQVQTRRQARPKSLDPDFPVFKHTPGRSGQIFVPDIAVRDEDGNFVLDEQGQPVLNWDRAMIHNLTSNVGGTMRYESIRCVNGLTVGEYDGTCPMCQAVSDCFELANHHIESACKKQGLDSSSDDKEVKTIKANAYKKNAVASANVYYTFPIVFIEKGQDGKVEATMYWYQVSQTQLEDKWLPAAKAYANDDEPTTIAGHLFLYMSSVDPSSKNAVRDAANKYSIQASPQRKNEEKLRKEFSIDKFAEWTPAKSRSTVVKNLLYPLEGLRELTNEFMQPTRELLNLINSGQSSDNTLGGTEAPLPKVIEAPITDEDDDMSPLLGIE